MNGNSVREVLEQPFPGELIKSRPGSFGQQLSYVEGHEYVKRLNDAFDGQWSFEIVSHEVNDSEVIVIGRLTAGGITKSAFGGCAVKRAKDTGEVISLADDLKAAATDALKKCSSLLGVGLHLYGSDTAQDTPNDNRPKQQRQRRTKPTNGDGNGNTNSDAEDGPRLSTKQLSYLLSLGKDRGLDRAALDEMAFEMYNVRIEFLSKGAASAMIDELKNAA